MQHLILLVLERINFLTSLRINEQLVHVADTPFSFQIASLFILTLKLRDALDFELLEAFHGGIIQHVLHLIRPAICTNYSHATLRAAICYRRVWSLSLQESQAGRRRLDSLSLSLIEAWSSHA